MNKDIRLSTSFKGHRKRKKLRRLIGDRAEIYLIDLWISVALDCPSGILEGWDDEDIADSCDWQGKPSDLIGALIESNWLEKDSYGNYKIHDWCDHQGWACKAGERSKAAKIAADARWKRKNGKSKTPINKGSNAESMRGASKPHAECNAPSPSPSPSPSPLPKEPPIVPQGKISKKEEFKNYLKFKIENTSFVGYQKELNDFIDYRMSMAARDRFKTERGIDGLLRCVGDLLRQNMDPKQCIKDCMDYEWKLPKPDWFKNKQKNNKSSNSLSTIANMRNNFINGGKDAR